MFTRIAGHYERANRWITFGHDSAWRREVIDHAGLRSGDFLLDVGTGTGDIPMIGRQNDKSIFTVGIDFTHAMLLHAKTRHPDGGVCWVNGDALLLPFPSGKFDAVVSGYLLRNVVDVSCALSEQYRVLKPGGRMVCLDTTPLPGDLWHLPPRLYLRYIVPLIGLLIARDYKAYTYLPQSTQRFIPAGELAQCMLEAGFKEVQFRRFMGGSMVIHWGMK
jgi:demethylmenaquinone methyltransferase/2-methoxy-6-polyprenyl-1,4-benzoquinol methylase